VKDSPQARILQRNGKRKMQNYNEIKKENQIRFKSSILGPNESFSKEETEYLIEQTLLTQLDDEPILVSGEHLLPLDMPLDAHNLHTI